MSNIAYFPVREPAEDNRPGKRERTKVANRQAILDAARAVFGELGYEAATVRDIIRRTGLAAGTFYNYYQSKEEVFAALADDGARRFAADPAGRVAPRRPTSRASLRGAIRAYFEFLADEHSSWRVNRPAGEICFPTPRRPRCQPVFAEVHVALAEVLERRPRPGRRPGLLGRRLHRHGPRGRRQDAGAPARSTSTAPPTSPSQMILGRPARPASPTPGD